MNPSEEIQVIDEDKMKPKLKYIDGMWLCFGFFQRIDIVGYGTTMERAYLSMTVQKAMILHYLTGY